MWQPHVAALTADTPAGDGALAAAVDSLTLLCNDKSNALPADAKKRLLVALFETRIPSALKTANTALLDGICTLVDALLSDGDGLAIITSSEFSPYLMAGLLSPGAQVRKMTLKQIAKIGGNINAELANKIVQTLSDEDIGAASLAVSILSRGGMSILAKVDGDIVDKLLHPRNDSTSVTVHMRFLESIGRMLGASGTDADADGMLEFLITKHQFEAVLKQGLAHFDDILSFLSFLQILTDFYSPIAVFRKLFVQSMMLDSCLAMLRHFIASSGDDNRINNSSNGHKNNGNLDACVGFENLIVGGLLKLIGGLSFPDMDAAFQQQGVYPLVASILTAATDDDVIDVALLCFGRLNTLPRFFEATAQSVDRMEFVFHSVLSSKASRQEAALHCLGLLLTAENVKDVKYSIQDVLRNLTGVAGQAAAAAAATSRSAFAHRLYQQWCDSQAKQKVSTHRTPMSYLTSLLSAPFLPLRLGAFYVLYGLSLFDFGRREIAQSPQVMSLLGVRLVSADSSGSSSNKHEFKVATLNS